MTLFDCMQSFVYITNIFFTYNAHIPCCNLTEQCKREVMEQQLEQWQHFSKWERLPSFKFLTILKASLIFNALIWLKANRRPAWLLHSCFLKAVWLTQVVYYGRVRKKIEHVKSMVFYSIYHLLNLRFLAAIDGAWRNILQKQIMAASKCTKIGRNCQKRQTTALMVPSGEL